MTRRDIEFDAEGVTLRLSAAEATGALVRPLGVFERMYHRYQQRSTMHFCVVAEPADDLDPSAPDVGLLAVQRRHPLLNVYVEDGSRTRLGVYRPAAVPPIPVTVVDARTGRPWRDLVAEELARRFDTLSAPMIRVVLLRSRESTAAPIVLTCAHVRLSAGYILRDLFAALNGHELETLPVPPSQVELIGRLCDAQAGRRAGFEQSAATGGTGVVCHPVLDSALRRRGAPPQRHHLRRREPDPAAGRPRPRRADQPSSRRWSRHDPVTIESGPNEFLRIVTPFAFRNHIGVDGDVRLYFTTICTALQREKLTDLWDMARTVSDQLAGGRSVPGLFGASAAERFITVDVPTTDPEGFLVGR
jgi:hypothetical protein